MTDAKDTVAEIKEIAQLCTGCGACEQACPVNAITMPLDAEGFPFPEIDTTVCIACGKCAAVCQVAHPGTDAEPLFVKGLYALDPNKRAAGSSGGVMGLLGERLLSSGGVVFGAIFDSSMKSVRHASTEEVDFGRLLRSKYSQSEAWLVYGDVRRFLREGKKVLFCGTPCQVAGLNRYLGKAYENLLTVDFFCHGVPSPGFFADYVRLKESRRSSSVSDVTFREKSHGWREQHMRWYYADGSVEEEPSLGNCHYFFFLGNYSLRKSCYGCELYKRHEADITLADYWLIDLALDDDLGTSLVLVNTKAGEDAVEALGGEVSELDVEGFDIGIYKHAYSASNREDFFALYRTGGAEAVCGDYFGREHASAERKNWIMSHGGVLLAGCRKLRKALSYVHDLAARRGSDK